MDKPRIKNALVGICIAGLITGISLLSPGCQKAQKAGEQGMATDTTKVEGESMMGSGADTTAADTTMMMGGEGETEE